MRGVADRSKDPLWLLNEVATAGWENLDPAHVNRYDDKEDADADAEVERLARLGLGPSSTIVDIGAGTGQFVLAVAPKCASVGCALAEYCGCSTSSTTSIQARSLNVWRDGVRRCRLKLDRENGPRPILTITYATSTPRLRGSWSR